MCSVCSVCAERTVGEISRRISSLVIVTQKCHHCKFVKTWFSQPFIGRMPAGNLLISAAILFSGSMISHSLRIFKFINVLCIGWSTFFRHQTSYLQPTIMKVWTEKQAHLVAQLTSMEDGLVLSGDGRSDSPGHCAKYGAYTIIEQQIEQGSWCAACSGKSEE